MPSMEHKASPILLKAIADSNIETLRSTLVSMVTASKECQTQATKHLLVHKHELISSSDDEDTSQPSKKRKVETRTGVSHEVISRYETCLRCHERFDITENSEEACQVHSGFMETDYDEFPDDDFPPSPTHKDLDSDWRIREFPTAFKWNCCTEDADGPPCVIDRHVTSAALMN